MRIRPDLSAEDAERIRSLLAESGQEGLLRAWTRAVRIAPRTHRCGVCGGTGRTDAPREITPEQLRAIRSTVSRAYGWPPSRPLSAAHFGKLIGRTDRTVRLWEAGTHPIPDPMRVRILALYSRALNTLSEDRRRRLEARGLKAPTLKPIPAAWERIRLLQWERHRLGQRLKARARRRAEYAADAPEPPY